MTSKKKQTEKIEKEWEMGRYDPHAFMKYHNSKPKDKKP